MSGSYINLGKIGGTPYRVHVAKTGGSLIGLVYRDWDYISVGSTRGVFTRKQLLREARRVARRAEFGWR